MAWSIVDWNLRNGKSSKVCGYRKESKIIGIDVLQISANRENGLSYLKMMSELLSGGRKYFEVVACEDVKGSSLDLTIIKQH